MKELPKIVEFLVIWTSLFTISSQIYVRNEQNQKPSDYSSGIKTNSYLKSSQIQLHHNYSKVYHQNNGDSSRNVSETENSFQRLYPVYSAGLSQPTQIYVINGTRIRKSENPTRQIVLYNTRKRTPQVEIYTSCPSNATGQFVYEMSCNQFLNCWHGRGYVQNCAAGSLFNPQTLQCDFPEKVHCISGPKQNFLYNERSARLVEQVSCPREFSGLIPNYQDCSRFINCVNGIENYLDCPPGTLFDSNKNICDFAHKVTCFNHQHQAITVDGKLDFGTDTTPCNQERSHCSQKLQMGCPGGQHCSQTHQHNFLPRQNEVITCPDGTSGLHKHPLDCSKFLNCANGQTYVQDCAPGTLFNPLLKVCDFPQNVNCQGDIYEYRRRPAKFPGSGDVGLGYGSSYGSPHGDPQHSQTTWSREGPSPYNTQYNPGFVIGYGPSNSGSRGFISGTYGGPSGTTCCQGQSNNPSQPTWGPDQQGFGRDQGSSGFIPGGSSGATCCQGQRNNPSQPTWGPDQQNNRQDFGRDKGYGGSRGFIPGAYSGSSGTTCCQGQSNNPTQPAWDPNQQNNRLGFGTGPGSDGSRGLGSGGYSGQEQQSNLGEAKWSIGHQGQHAFRETTPPCCPQQNDPQRTGIYHTQYNRGTVDQSSPRNQYNGPMRGQYGATNQNGQEGWQQQNQKVDDEEHREATTPNFSQVVNINYIKTTTKTPSRPPYEPFYGTTERAHRPQPVDYDDTVGVGRSQKYIRATTPKMLEKRWPPPFPSTDVNADYVFDYDGNTIELEPENPINNNGPKHGCTKNDFSCYLEKCIAKTSVCDGVKDCPNAIDEMNCREYVSRFSLRKDSKLAVLEQERWDNITVATCALLCVEAIKFQCKSFNYRKIDKTCFLTNTNEGLTGAIIFYYLFDYYELSSEKFNCSGMYVCENKKCIHREQICDGHDDCGDRMDEKGCKPEDFEYSVRLTGSKRPSEGHVEITAFGKTGYLCDDKFGLRDGHVVCKELGFELGALQVRGNSFYANSSVEKPFYMMDDVTCIGNETRLMDCDFSGWGVHNCLGQEIAGVVCKTPQEKCPQEYWQCDTGQECLPLAFVCDGLLDCADGSDEGSQHCDAPTEIRLVNGSNSQEGRVEIKHNGIWGTICDDDFNEDAAKVICRHLGYKGSAVVKKDSYFGPGTGPIWLDQVFCAGNETKVESCTHWDWGEHNCEHSEDVGLICSNVYEQERHSAVPVQIASGEYPTQCGYRKDNIFGIDDDVHFRVVKASIARKGDYPWQAAIRVKGKTKAAHWCGAVIISEKFVLTAAHCLVGYPKGAYIVVAGDYNVDENEGTEQEAYIEDYHIHENFRKGHKMNNDIALVKLKGRGFGLNQDIQSICLPDSDTTYETDLNCTISGFGSIESGKSAFSHNLRAGWVPIQSRDVCTMPHVYGDALTEGMICAGSLDEGIDSCDGDSGGPLACLNNGVFTLYGITSWGQHCGYANKPGVYVKVAHYRKWIDENFHKYDKAD